MKDTYTSAEFIEMMKKGTFNSKGRLIVPEGFEVPSTPKDNRKIVGAKKIEVDGIIFDSRLEMAMHSALIVSKLPFMFKQTICLIEGFIYGDKKIRDITWSPDFFIPYLKIILDTKGYSNDIAPLKIKLCKYWLMKQNMLDWQIWIVKKKSEIPNTINQLLTYKTGDKSNFEV